MDDGKAAPPIDRILIKRFNLAGLSACLILLFFYWIGNFQYFLDTSLLLLLVILAWTAPFIALLSLAGIFAVVFRPKRGETQPRRVLGIVGYALAFLSCLALFLLARFLMAVLGVAS